MGTGHVGGPGPAVDLPTKPETKIFPAEPKKGGHGHQFRKEIKEKKKREFVFQIFETAHNHSGTKFTPHEDEFLGPHNSSELTQIKNWREGLAFQFPTSIFRFKQLPHGLHYFCFEV